MIYEEPVAFLKGLTPEAQAAIFGNELAIPRFPFRIGRESRGREPHRLGRGHSERRVGRGTPNNDLYLRDEGRCIYVSREHLTIDQADDGYVLIDRGSTLGTWVEGRLIGGAHKGGSVALAGGDVIFVGDHRGGYIFKFLLEKGVGNHLPDVKG
jgi:pSer/pThr/pTyr-binding forkhead associated (FHA) protein